MGMPIYMAIAGHEGSIQVAYVDWHRDYRATRLQVVSSRDAGETWSAPVVLNPDTERNVTGTWIFASPTGDLHVLWIETAGDLIFGSASLHHAWRSSGSTEWQEESPFPLPVGMGHSVAAVDPCGGLHLVWVVVNESGVPGLAYFQKLRAGWAQVEIPVTGVASLGPALDADHSGLYLAWNEVHVGSSGEQPGVKVMVARRQVLH
jgi:hypothetical protein